MNDERESRDFGFDVTHNNAFNFVYEMPFRNRFKGIPGHFSLPDRVADGRLGANAWRRLWYDRIRAASSSFIPDGVRNGEIRGLRNPMRVIQFAAKIYF